ncbi:MAG: cupin domain-containing protein [Chloroflexi bacterium]|nr:cupin domain-containing protein [Chloroflexota bacterium]
MPLTILSPSETASRMDRAFAPVQIGTVGDVGVLVFVAQGEINWHRHIDEDEIFLTHEGSVKINTQLGNTLLRVGEALMIPKGVAHHSGATEPAIVLLFRQQVMPERKNGHRKNMATGEEPPLKKVRFADVLSDSTPDYQPMKVAAMESHAMTVFTAHGSGVEEKSKSGGTMLYTLYGDLEIRFDTERALLAQGQMTFLPRETRYRLHAGKSAIVVRFERE